MDAWLPGLLQRVSRGADIRLHAARKRANARLNRTGNRAHSLKIAGARAREPGFYHVHAQKLQVARKIHLFVKVEADARGLLAVAQGGIQKKHRIPHVVLRLFQANLGKQLLKVLFPDAFDAEQILRIGERAAPLPRLDDSSRGFRPNSGQPAQLLYADGVNIDAARPAALHASAPPAARLPSAGENTVPPRLWSGRK